MVAPRHEVPGVVETTFQEVVAAGAEEVVARVVFARPQQLDRDSRLLRDERGLKHVVEVQAPAEAPTHAGQVDRDLVLGNAHGLAEVAARELGRLGRRPHLELAIAEVGRRVLRLERRVGEEGILVGGLERLRRRTQRAGRIAVAREGLLRGLLRQCLRLTIEVLGALGRGRSFLPGDLELAPCLVDQPPGIANDGDTVDRQLRGVRVDDEGIGDAGRRLDGVEVDALHTTAVDRALLEHGVLHPGHRDVDAEQRLANDDLRVVYARNRLPDDREVLRVLERDGPRIGRLKPRRGTRQFAVGHRLVLEVDDSGFGRALLRLGAPLLRRGFHEHGASGSPGAAHRLVVHRRRHAAAGHLAPVLGRVEVRLLHAHLTPGDVEFLGDEHRQHRLDALPDLGILGHDRHHAIRREADERVEDRLDTGIGNGGAGAARTVQSEAHTEEHSSSCQGGDLKEAASRDVARSVHGAHASLPPVVSLTLDGACAISAARWIAARIRV